MNSLKVVMIHEVTQDVLSKDLSTFENITFDDGLYSQYLNLEHYTKLPQPKYFFISSNIICPEHITQSTESLYCADAHQKAFNGNFENYMKWSQILKIYNTPNCFIGGHSHTHKVFQTLKENVQDTQTMFNTFKNNNIKINSYCYPYNNDYTLRKLSVKSIGITNIFGGERVPVESI